MLLCWVAATGGACGGGAQALSGHDAGPILVQKPDASAATPDAHPALFTNGQACSDDGQCGSSFCTDGVCCATRCAGICQTCVASGLIGTCAPADLGTDPHHDCQDTGAATCGTDGICDGAGACQKYPAGVTCQAPSCNGQTLTSAGRCDGLGTCATGQSHSCAPFTCGDDDACKTACQTNTDCGPGLTCTNGSCGLRPVGATCAAGTDCNSGFCAQGVCCATACAGTCRSCALAGSTGTCTAVPAGQDPLTQCSDRGAASCGTDGSCDGAGACRNYPAGTNCHAASCAGASFQPASTCNAGGSCTAPAPAACAPYVCASTGCKTSCQTSADCASPTDTCSAGACVRAASVSVKTHTVNGGNTQWIYFDLQLTNGGTSAISFADLEVDYWYTWEGTSGGQSWQCTYATGLTGGCGNLAPQFIAVSPTRAGADHKLEVGFATAAGSLAPGATLDIGPGFHKDDFSVFVQTNDYSYSSATAFTATTKVTVYVKGALVYGTEP